MLLYVNKGEENMADERNYGIDLLRLVLMSMVCILHILGQGGVLAANQKGSVGYSAFWFLETCSYCAVDGFAIISGYISARRTPKWNKLVNMWFQAFFYSFILTILLIPANLGSNIEISALFSSAIPVTSNYFWYFTAYFALFFAMPMLDLFIDHIDIHTARKAIVIILLFSIIGLPFDAFKTQSGYSAIWLMILYCLGALAKKTDLFSAMKSSALIIIYFALSVISWAGMIVLNTSQLINYISPTILMNALVLVILFSRLKIKSTLIKKLSPLAFGIYLFQLNAVIWNDVLKDSMVFIAAEPLAAGVCYVILFSFLLFSTGLITEFLRSKIANALRIPVLSQKIADLFSKMLSKTVQLFR